MVPCCFHPTRVVVIDDSTEFLESMDRTLSKNHASYQYMSDPQKALYYLNEVYQPNPFPNRYIEAMEEEEWEHRCLDINIFDTYHEVYRPERFNEISVLIVDHAMPGMSGLELCRKIKDPNIQKILLTGVADEHLAIHAFNEGIINHYIRKQDMDMVDQLNQAVEKAQWRYFNKLSEITFKAITAIDHRNHAVVDPNFQNFFTKIMQQSLVAPYRFKEAYLCEAMGSYVLLTETGEVYGLVVNNDGQIEAWTDSEEALKADPQLLEELANRTKMMWYHNRSGTLEPPGKEWVNHAYVPEILKGAKEDYYYIFAPNLFDVDRARVLSFEAYKASQRFEIQH